MDSLLTDLNVQEDINISYASTRKQQYRDNFNQHKKMPSSTMKPSTTKSCILCKMAGRNHQGHDISNCWFISKFEKLNIAKALQVDVDYDNSEINIAETELSESFVDPQIQKVQCDVSPFLYAFYKHQPTHVVLDTGATSSLVSRSYITSVDETIQPTKHSARSVDKSSLKIHGEVHLTLTYSSITLPITALVVDGLDCDILAGVPFCKENDITVHLRDEMISIGDVKVPYGTKSEAPCHDIYRTDSFILRSDTNQVLLPGDFVEFKSDSLKDFEGEVAIEPHSSSLMYGSWPSPSISRVINGTVRIPNNSNDPIPVKRSQHFAQIRRVVTPVITDVLGNKDINIQSKFNQNNSSNHSTLVTVNPDGLISDTDAERFKHLNNQYDSVFDPDFRAYNDYSGTVRAKVNLSSVQPTPRKGKLPLYKHSTMQLLQEEADKLEARGVLAKPEEIGVDVLYVSPSFLVKKPTGGYRFVTAFNDLGQYTRILPTASTSCNDVLRQISSWKYVIKTDLTKSFFQIPVAKSSIPYLGTVTPFKGLRVYLRAAMGMPGSSEYS